MTRAAKWDRADRRGSRQQQPVEQSTHDLSTLVARSLPKRGSAVLAVSGGLDSMALLDVAAGVRQRRGCAIVVATFDHASGTYSARAAALVSRSALAYGLPVVCGTAGETQRTEAAWRAARWAFLRSVARRVNGPVITAHTSDDQVETVLMRAMRGASARGLAGLRARSSIRRPFLDVQRAELHAYARAHGLTWLDDPSNRSAKYLRNRIRQELLPVLLCARPTLADELRAIGERAARLRIELAAFVDSAIRLELRHGGAALDVAVGGLVARESTELMMLWPELASRAGATLDRRGIRRATEFTIAGRIGGRIQISGGWELVRSRDWFELRNSGDSGEPHESAQTLVPPMTWDVWRFSSSEEAASKGDPWKMELPRGASVSIRRWRAGDRLTVRQNDRLSTRKVKYFLSDARISGHIRAKWPVVLAGDEIVWIPGVRRSDAATARSGGPVVTYVCDYLDRRP